MSVGSYSVSVMVREQVGALDAAQVLDAVEIWRGVQVDAEGRIFPAVAGFADLHNPDSPPGRGGRVLPGMGRPVRLAGAGTPRVWEFAVAQLGAGRSPSPTPASTSGATPTDAPTWSTTPAPASLGKTNPADTTVDLAIDVHPPVDADITYQHTHTA
jgi:hypothetical protein